MSNAEPIRKVVHHTGREFTHVARSVKRKRVLSDKYVSEDGTIAHLSPSFLSSLSEPDPTPARQFNLIKPLLFIYSLYLVLFGR